MSLRNGKKLPPDTSDLDSMTSRPASPQRSRITPYLLLIYPILIALGSAFYYVSPIARSQATGYSAPFTPGVVSDQHAQAIPHTLSYFASKRNLFNVYFVKIGWFWTTLAFAILPLTTARSNQKQGRVLRAFLRYTIITLAWVITTKWFFGPALIDRSFVLTGGHCEALPVPDPISSDTTAKINALPTLISAVACKTAGGHWRGGHDISGHVFMLVLSSAFLLYEVQVLDSQSARISPAAAANLAKDLSEEEKSAVGGWDSQSTAALRVWGRRFVYAVIGLDLWMLMMTAVFFHTWLEKLSGLVVAGGALWSVYFLGDFVPAWRGITGL